MRARDFKIAAIITGACLILSLGASYSYARGLYWTDGVFPLALTVILVLLMTVILDIAGTRANVRRRHGSSSSKSRAVTISPIDVLLSPFHVLIFLLLVILEAIHSILLRSRRSHSSHVMRAPHGAHP